MPSASRDSKPSPPADGLLTCGPDGVRFVVRLTPRASRAGLNGVIAEADGTPVLRASVTAVPENGKANAALIALLAKSWRLPKSALTIVSGATDRRKTIHLAGDPAVLADLLRGKIVP